VTRWHPDAEWLDERFQELIEQRAWFATTQPEARPVLVLLAGQPGAGKTRAHQFVRELHGRDFEAITGDDFRAYHPDFEDLQRNDPTAMPRLTQEVSGPLVARAISYGRDHRLSIILEGTFRDPPVVLDTARTFQQAGFAVHVVALAVPPQISRLSTLGRFYTTLGTGQNRWTPPHAHEASVAALPHTVDDLARSPDVDKITHHRPGRDGTGRVQHPGRSTSNPHGSHHYSSPSKSLNSRRTGRRDQHRGNHSQHRTTNRTNTGSQRNRDRLDRASRTGPRPHPADRPRLLGQPSLKRISDVRLALVPRPDGPLAYWSVRRRIISKPPPSERSPVATNPTCS
jgi:Zeta toxin